MPEDATDPMLDAALTERFLAPPLSALRSDLVQNWANAIPGAALRQSMLSNPRLESRIVARIMHDVALPDRDALAQSPDNGVIAALMCTGPFPLAVAVATAWHRATVLEWITWNTLKDHLRSITMEQARAYVAAPSEDTLAMIKGAKSDAQSLNDETLLTNGQQLLGMWASELDPDLDTRLRLFVDIKPLSAHPVASALVRDLAPVVLAETARTEP